MPLPSLGVRRIFTWCVGCGFLYTRPSVTFTRGLTRLVLRLGHVARQDGHRFASSHRGLPVVVYRDQCVLNLGTLCFGLRVVCIRQFRALNPSRFAYVSIECSRLLKRGNLRAMRRNCSDTLRCVNLAIVIFADRDNIELIFQNEEQSSFTDYHFSPVSHRI